MLSRPLGAYKPHFEGHPDDYFPVTWGDIIASIALLLLYVGGTLGMMIGFIYWVMSDGVPRYTMIWSLVAVGFVTIVLIAIYFGVRRKIAIERQLIQEKLRKEREKLKRDNR